MALGNTSSAIYLTVSDGKIIRQFREPNNITRERVSKTGKTVHEAHYDYVDGRIIAIATRENDYGKFWNITLEDEGEKYILQFNYSGGTASAFLKTLPNVDLTRPVKLVPKQTIEGEKKKSTLFINQDGKALKWFWNKDNQGDLPQLKKVKVKGKEQWDDSDMMEYLENYVTTNIIPKLSGVATAEPVVNSQEDEDLPF